MSNFDITPELYELFKTESTENIAIAEAALLRLEKSIDPRGSIDELFRAIHTIKGSAVYLGLDEIKDVTHAFETVLDGFRKLEVMSISKDQLDIFFDVLNLVTHLVASAPQSVELSMVTINQAIEKLKHFSFDNASGSEIVASEAPQLPVVNTNRMLKIFKDTVGQQMESILLIRKKTLQGGIYNQELQQMMSRGLKCIFSASEFVGDPELEKLTSDFQEWISKSENQRNPEVIAEKIDRYLASLYDVFGKSAVKSQENSTATAEKTEVKEETSAAVNIEVTTSEQTVDSGEETSSVESSSEINEEENFYTAEELSLSSDLSLEQKTLVTKLNPVSTGLNAKSPVEGGSGLVPDGLELNKIGESKTVRVDQDALDDIMNLVGELIVIRNAFSHIQTKFGAVGGDFHEALKDLRDSSGRLTHITGELQRNVMEMRMVPIKTVFQRYPRIVRDVCRKTGKNVEVFFEGEDTEIDRGIADLITDPLVHIVRNAVDHGIETSDVRKKSGKQSTGTIIMKAFHQGNFMVIEILDDGGGINIERIRTKIVEKGLMNAEEAALLQKEELVDYIFHPGFSTAAQITDISGRGVGLDVVRTNLKKIKGTVTVSSELEQGTCFRLEVPLTMAIMRAILIRSNQAIYAIALQDVSETVKIHRHELKSIHQKHAITLRGEVVIVDWLSHLLGYSADVSQGGDEKLSILILQVGEKRFGLIVDSVYKQEEIVIKPLPDFYAAVQGLAGASILGDGKAILILDSAQLQDLINKSTMMKPSENKFPDVVA